MAVTREDVNAFWVRQEWNLSLPQDTSPLELRVLLPERGSANLQDIHTLHWKTQRRAPRCRGFGPLDDTPCDLRWWMRIEALYGRDLHAEKRKVRSDATHIGFFGTHPFAYKDLADGRDLSALSETLLPCDCTE